MTVKLGTNPIAWSNDDLRELGAQTSLETCLHEARQAGFSGIELGHKFPRTKTALKPILDRHDLVLISGWYSTALLTREIAAEIAAIQSHLDLLKAMNCSVLIAAETTDAIHGDRDIPLSKRPSLTPGQIADLGRKMTDLGDYVASHGLTLVYHHHMGTVIQSEVDIHTLMTATGPSVQLLLDTGHATFAGANPTQLAERYRSRIGHIHCKDVRQSVLADVLSADRSFLDSVVAGVFTVPGDGMVDFPSVFAALKPQQYDGWLVVEAEQDPEKANPARYAKLGHDNLHRYAAQAGLL